MKISYLFLCLALTFAFTSCKKDDDSPGDPNAYDNPGSLTAASSTVYFRCKVDGQDWEATAVLGAHTEQTQTGTTVRQYTLKGQQDDANYIQFALQWYKSDDFVPGSYDYNLGGNDVYGTMIMGYQDQSWTLVTDSVPTANVTISTQNGNRTTGTFHARITNYQGDTLQLTDGAYGSDNIIFN